MPASIYEYIYPTARTIELAEQCEPIGKPSAQFCVYKLPRRFTREVSPTGRMDDTVEMQRVAKIPLPSALAIAAIRNMRITEASGIQQKLQALRISAHMGYKTTCLWASRDIAVDRLLGYPNIIPDPTYEPNEVDKGALPYTQDLIPPIPDLIAQLDVSHNPHHQKRAFRIIDTMVEKNAEFLPQRKLFEGTFKLDNWGISVPLDDRFVTAESRPYLDQTRMLDIYEPIQDLDTVIALIERRPWYDNALKPAEEYTPLADIVQEYFVQACDKRITPDTIRNNWGKKPSVDTLPPRCSVIDYHFPKGLCLLLAQRALQALSPAA